MGKALTHFRKYILEEDIKMCSVYYATAVEIKINILKLLDAMIIVSIYNSLSASVTRKRFLGTDTDFVDRLGDLIAAVSITSLDLF